MDSHRLLNWQWRFSQQIPLCYLFISVFSRHVLRLFGASDSHKSLRIKQRRPSSHGHRLNGKKSINNQDTANELPFQAVIFFGQTCASYLLSFIVSLSFEAPVCALLRILSKLNNNKQK
jgi:hypothetical protein